MTLEVNYMYLFMLLGVKVLVMLCFYLYISRPISYNNVDHQKVGKCS